MRTVQQSMALSSGMQQAFEKLVEVYLQRVNLPSRKKRWRTSINTCSVISVISISTPWRLITRFASSDSGWSCRRIQR